VTLNEGVDKRFIELLVHHSFPFKKALDIGCGTGNYLAFLESKSFVVNGIDSNPTNIEMTQKIATKSSNIVQADMYEFEYPQNVYNLILSVSTLHHGIKKQVKFAIRKVYESLVPDGKIFITLPNLDASKTLETYSSKTGPEAGIPHSFSPNKKSEICSHNVKTFP